MVPDWLLPLAGTLLAFGVLLGSWPAGSPPAGRGLVVTILVALALLGFGAVTVIALTNGA
jgi:hypothetical protein